MGIYKERWLRRRESVERWKMEHYEYYLEQKRRLAHRPEYLAHRRAMYRVARSKSQSVRLSTSKTLNELEEAETRSDHCVYYQPEPAKSPLLGDWLGAT